MRGRKGGKASEMLSGTGEGDMGVGVSGQASPGRRVGAGGRGGAEGRGAGTTRMKATEQGEGEARQRRPKSYFGAR